MTALQDRMKRKLDELDFDFSTFTIESFTAHIGAKLKRRIKLVPLKLPPGLYAAWVSDAELPLEYIFFNQDLPRLHREHSQLHELGHLICGHKTLKVGGRELAHFEQNDQLSGILCRSERSRSNREEQEAEELAALVRAQSYRSTAQASPVASSSEAGKLYLGAIFRTTDDSIQ